MNGNVTGPSREPTNLFPIEPPRGSGPKGPGGKLDWGWIFKSLFFLAVGGTLLLAIIGGAVFWHFARDLPQIVTLADYRPPTVTRILATGVAGGSPEKAAGEKANAQDPSAEPKAPPVIGEFHGGERRYVIPYEKIPEIVVRAFISAEDDHFFEHPGINIPSIIRAAICWSPPTESTAIFFPASSSSLLRLGSTTI